MGDVAEMMLDGTLCCDCGSYIGEPVGYPVSCCKDDDLDDELEEGDA